MKYYKDALYIAAAYAYESEVVQPEMEQLIIGEGKGFETRREWIEARVEEWLEEAEIEVMMSEQTKTLGSALERVREMTVEDPMQPIRNAIPHLMNAASELERLRGALNEIAQASEHLDDERFEETHGTVAVNMRRLARAALEGAL